MLVQTTLIRRANSGSALNVSRMLVNMRSPWVSSHLTNTRVVSSVRDGPNVDALDHFGVVRAHVGHRIILTI